MKICGKLMHDSQKIEILIPITEKDVPELLDLLQIMKRPRASGIKCQIYISMDTIVEKVTMDSILDKFKCLPCSAWFNVKFFDCILAESESFYIRGAPTEFDIDQFPYGSKSGPNIQFFRSLRYLLEDRSRIQGPVLLLETDMTPLNDGWLDEIEAEISEYGDFLIAGSIYKGNGMLPLFSRRHINGGAVYNLGNIYFEEFLSSYEELLKLSCPYSYHMGYDVLPSWLEFNLHRFSGEQRIKALNFIGNYNNSCFRISSISNYAGQAETHNGNIFDYNVLSDASLLHLRAKKEVRESWILFKENLIKGAVSEYTKY